MRTRLPLLAAATIAAAAPLDAQLADSARPHSSRLADPPGSLRFADVRLRTGVRLRYAEQGDTQGEAVVLLHGLADSWFSFSRVLPSLPSSLRVFALDQRGHGDSDRPASGYTVADYSEDVIAFLDAMRLQQATIIGHSMGAFVAQRVAIISPDRVKRLVLIGGAATARNEVLLGLQQELATLGDPLSADFLREFQYGTVHAPIPATFMDRVIAESGKVPVRVMRGALDGLLASGDSSEVDAIRAPTLMLWGDRDAIFSQGDRLALRKAIPAGDLRVYAEIGHALHWEAPDRFVNDLLAFIARSGTR